MSAIDQPVRGLDAVQPDVTLLLDHEGVIREATLSGAMPGESAQAWLGQFWPDTVNTGGSDQVRRMVADATSTGVSAFGQVVQRFPSGLELPIEYTTVRLGNGAGLLAVGKSVQSVLQLKTKLVAAQRAREQDYWKLREVETRYRMLFDATDDAVVLVAADTMRIIDANPAAIRAFGFGKGADILSEFAAADQGAVRSLLLRARDQGRVPGILVHTGASAQAWVVRASITPAEAGPGYLLQFAAVGPASQPAKASAAASADPFVDYLPDGFVVADAQGIVRRANHAFLDLAQLGAEAAALGQNLGQWLRQPGADFAALKSFLERHGVVRLFTTTLHGELGTECEVEISATLSRETTPPAIALVLRNIERRGVTGERSGPAVVAQAVSRVGSAPMSSLVQEATEVVERQCIAAALEKTDGNRSAAAEILGLSRQSLYLKLNRYSMARPGPAEEEA